MRVSLFTSSFKLVGAVLFLICLWLVCKSIGDIYYDSNQRNKISVWNKQRFDEFYEMPKDTVDMVFIGSSHSYCTFDPGLIDEALGVNSFQMGMPLQHPDSSYYTLLEVCKTQSPDTVVMELYWDMLDDAFELKQAESLFQAMRDTELQDDYIKKVFPLSEKVKYNIPVIRYQQDFLAERSKIIAEYFENSYDLKKEEEKQVGTEGYKKRGFIFCDWVITEDKMNRTNQFHGLDGKKWEIDRNQMKYLEKIVQLCRENDISLIFVTAPVATASMEIIKNYSYIYEKVSGFAEENSVPYLDFNMVNMFENKHFRDDAHLNYSGVEIACKFFAEWYGEERAGF